MTTPLGSFTGSVISVSMSGSVCGNTGQACKEWEGEGGLLTFKLFRNVAICDVLFHGGHCVHFHKLSKLSEQEYTLLHTE